MREMTLKTPDDISRIREAGRIIGEIFRALRGMNFNGVSSWDIDVFIDDAIRERRARPSFKTIRNYDFASCISINHEIVHGLPSKRKIVRSGDIVKIDIGVVKNGYFADACVTFAVEPVSETAKKLIDVTGEALRRAIVMLVPGRRLGDIGHAIQQYAEGFGFSVVRDFTGHGVGFAVHEQPTVPHFGVEGTGVRLEAGMVLAIEPMINEGGHEVRNLGDGWTVVTADGKLSAQFEHTIAVTESGPRILTI